MTEPLDLEAIEKACAEATPGPWRCVSDPRDNEDHIFSAAGGQSGAGTIATARRYLPPAKPSAEGEFIANARSWVPALVAKVRELHKALESCRELTVPAVIELAREHEREACALIAESRGDVLAADAIRARGKP